MMKIWIWIWIWILMHILTVVVGIEIIADTGVVGPLTFITFTIIITITITHKNHKTPLDNRVNLYLSQHQNLAVPVSTFHVRNFKCVN
jgi:hypothetical protein